MTTDVVAVLTKAKELVQRGWIQNRAQDGHGRVCAAQALGMATEELNGHEVTPQDIEVPCRLVLRAAEEQTNMGWPNIPCWNDWEGRTKAEVVDTFDHAIKLAERDFPAVATAG